MPKWNPGRPLTAWEERMKQTRTDLWEPAFGNVYRFFLPYRLICELESISGPVGSDGQPSGKGIAAIAAGIPDARMPARQNVGTRDECVSVIRYALLGGEIGIVNGAQITVTPAVVDEIIATHVDPAPLVAIWPLARKIVDALLFGRQATEEEIENFAIPSRGPVVPAWARAQVEKSA